MTNKIHFVIGTFARKDVDISNDLKLIKAAILYADEITLNSPPSYLLFEYLKFNPNTDGVYEFYELLRRVKNISSDEDKITYQNYDDQLKAVLGKTKKNDNAISKMILKRQLASEFYPQIQEAIYGLAGKEEFLSIKKLVDQKIVNIGNFGMGKEFSFDLMALNYFLAIVQSVRDPNIFPLLDNDTEIWLGS